jgi:hypothetical protein
LKLPVTVNDRPNRVPFTFFVSSTPLISKSSFLFNSKSFFLSTLGGYYAATFGVFAGAGFETGVTVSAIETTSSDSYGFSISTSESISTGVLSSFFIFFSIFSPLVMFSTTTSSVS